LAKPVYWLARDRSRTWDPVRFSLLAVNSAFTAASACLVASLAHRVTRNSAVSLFSAAVYLLNWVVPNSILAGLIDSSEAFLMLSVTAALFAGKWWCLPLLGILGGLAKESFVVLSAAFAAGWWLTLASRTRPNWRNLGWVFALGATSIAAVILVQSAISGTMAWPWAIAENQHRHTVSVGDTLQAIVISVTDRSFWYVFIWLLPLGIWQLGSLPRPWVVASCCAAAAALLLGGYATLAGTVARPVFHAVGALLSVSTALTLVRIHDRATAEPK
jgi:hypothetical protein